MNNRANILGLIAIAFTFYCPVAMGDEKSPQVVKVSWESDYLHAMDVANRQKRMLLIDFHDPNDAQSRRLENETLASSEVQQKLQDFVCVRLPTDAKVTNGGKEVTLLRHPSMGEMLGRPGVVIADFVQADPKRHADVVSVFPLTPSISYGPAEMQVILDLPPGTLTQRTLIYAVRIHPERPASALDLPDARLLAEAESHSQFQANIRLQGHHNWNARFSRIAAVLGLSPREVCAESWPGQSMVESAIECVRCWRLSSGHWSAVQARNRAFGYDMKLGANGIWYATGIFAN